MRSLVLHAERLSCAHQAVIQAISIQHRAGRIRTARRRVRRYRLLAPNLLYGEVCLARKVDLVSFTWADRATLVP